MQIALITRTFRLPIKYLSIPHLVRFVAITGQVYFDSDFIAAIKLFWRYSPLKFYFRPSFTDPAI